MEEPQTARIEREPITICIDQGEAYGNLGDEAMLLNALSRLQAYLGPCRFILLCEPGKPLSPLLPHVEKIPPPRLTVRGWERVLRRCFSLVNRISLPAKLEKSGIGGLIWHLPWLWVKLKVWMWRIGALTSPGKDLEPFLRIIDECDVFYAVGAAQLNDFNLPGVVYKSWLFSIAAEHTRAAVASSQAIGPLDTEWAGRVLVRALSRLDLLSFRDHALSRATMTRYGLSGVPNEVVFDEAFTLAPGTPAAVNEYMEACGVPDGAPFLAIHFRSTDYTRETTLLLPRISNLLDEIIDAHGHYLVFFPMSYHTHSRMDEDYGNTIRAKMRRSERMLVAPLSRDVTLVKGAVARAQYSLGLSYHLHIFSLSSGHPALILYTGEYYKCKSEGLVEFYGPPNRAIDLAKVSDSRILQHVSRVEDNYANTCSAVASVNQELLRQNDRTLARLAEIRNSWG